MVNKYYDGGAVPSEIGADGERVTFGEEYDWPVLCAEAAEEATRAVNAMELPKAAQAAIALVVKVDLFITETEPFRMAKDETKREELARCCTSAWRRSASRASCWSRFCRTRWRRWAESMDLGKGTFAERVKWERAEIGVDGEEDGGFPAWRRSTSRGSPSRRERNTVRIDSSSTKTTPSPFASSRLKARRGRLTFRAARYIHPPLSVFSR